MLDPTNVTAAQVTGTFPKGDLPKLTEKQLQFGHVPDLTALRPGDLILKQAIKPGGFERMIAFGLRRTQPLAGHWTHAAMYVKEWRIIEAQPFKNVSAGDLLTWLPGYKILVRRPLHFHQMQADRGLLAGYEMVAEAALLMGEGRYGYLAAGAASTGSKRSGNGTRNDELICSGLYAKCFSVSTGQQLLTPNQNRTDHPITPPLLAGLTSLVTVNVGWLKLV